MEQTPHASEAYEEKLSLAAVSLAIMLSMICMEK